MSHAGRQGIRIPTDMLFTKKLWDLCQDREWTREVIDQDESECTGLNNNVIWIQHIIVNGSEKATGRARNKRLARNNAAEQLYARLKDAGSMSEGLRDERSGRR